MDASNERDFLNSAKRGGRSHHFPRQMEKRARHATEWSWPEWRAMVNAGPITTDGEHHPSNVFDPSNVTDVVEELHAAFLVGQPPRPLHAVQDALSVLEIQETFYESHSNEEVLRLATQMKDSIQLSLHYLQVYVLAHKAEVDDDTVETMNKHISVCIHKLSSAIKVVSDVYSLKEMPEDSSKSFELVNDYEMNKENLIQWLGTEFIHFMERGGLLLDSVGHGENATNIIVEQKRGTYRYYDNYEWQEEPKAHLFNNILNFLKGPLHKYLLNTYGDEYRRGYDMKNHVFKEVAKWYTTVGVVGLKAVFRLPHVISVKTRVEFSDGSEIDEPGVIVLCHKSGDKTPSYPRLFNRDNNPMTEEDYYEYDIPRNFSSRWCLHGESVPVMFNGIAQHLAAGGYFVPTASQSCAFSDISADGDELLTEKLDYLMKEKNLSMDAIWHTEEDDDAIDFREKIDFTCKQLLKLAANINPTLKDFYNVFIVQKYGEKIDYTTLELDPKKATDGDDYPYWELACAIAFGMGMNLAPALYKPSSRDGDSVLRQYFNMTQFASYIWGLPRTGKSIVQMLGLETFKPEQIHYTDNQKSKTFNGLDTEHLVSAMVDNQNEGNGNTGLANSFALPLISKEPVRHESKFQQPQFAVFRGRFFGVGNATLENSPAMSRRLIVMHFNNQVPPEVIQSTLKENLRNVLPLITWLSMTLFSWIDHIFAERAALPQSFLPKRFSNDKKDYDNSDTLSFFLSTEFEMGGDLTDKQWVALTERISGRIPLKEMYATWEKTYTDVVATLQRVEFTEDRVKAYCTNQNTMCSNLTAEEKREERIKSNKSICVLRRCRKAQVEDPQPSS